MHFIVRFSELIISEIQSGWASTCITAFFLCPTGLEAADDQSQSLKLLVALIVLVIRNGHALSIDYKIFHFWEVFVLAVSAWLWNQAWFVRAMRKKTRTDVNLVHSHLPIVYLSKIGPRSRHLNPTSQPCESVKLKILCFGTDLNRQMMKSSRSLP